MNLNDLVLYGTTGVCTVASIENKKIGRVTRKYYVLKPISQSTATVFVPADNNELLSKVRRILTLDEINELLKLLLDKENIWYDNDNERKVKYSEIVSSGDRLSCLVLLRTLQFKQKELVGKGKRLHIVDERFLKEAQRLIYDEFSIVMKKPIDEVDSFIKNEFKACEKI